MNFLYFFLFWFVCLQVLAFHRAFNTRTCLELADVCQEVGLPSGVLNILTGLGPEAGAPLASHPHVDKVLLSLQTLTLEILHI